MGQTLPSWGQGEGSHQYQYRSVNCRYPVIKRAIIAINKTVNIITQYNTSHYTCQQAGKRGYICLRPALWQGKHIQRKGSYQRYWPHRDLCRSTDYNWNRGQMVENIEYWSDSFLVPENHIVSKFLLLSHTILGTFLVNKLFQFWSKGKKFLTKVILPITYWNKKIIFRKIRLTFDGENWVWKTDFCIF